MFGIILFIILTVPVTLLASTIEQIFSRDELREMGVELGYPPE